MEPDIQHLFAIQARPARLPELEARVLQKVSARMESDGRLARRLAAFSLAGSFTLFLTALFAFGENLWRSDFWQLLSLLASDLAALSQNLSTFLFSLAETFPAVSLAALLFPLFILSLSIVWYGSLKQEPHFNRYHYS